MNDTASHSGWSYIATNMIYLFIQAWIISQICTIIIYNNKIKPDLYRPAIVTKYCTYKLITEKSTLVKNINNLDIHMNYGCNLNGLAVFIR